MIGWIVTISGSIVLALVVLIVVTSVTSTKKTKILHQIEILTDELDRQKKENISLRNDLRQITSRDSRLFNALSRLTGKKSEPREISQETVSLLVNYLNATEVAVFLLDNKQEWLHITSQFGLNENWVPKIVFRVGEGKVGAAVEKKHPIGQSEADILRLTEPYPVFNPDLCQPIKFEDKIYGVIAVKRLNDFDDREENIIGVIANITGGALNNALSFKDLKDESARDSLTQLLNVGHFRDLIGEEITRARSFGRSLSLSIIDLDNFKYYNDTLGHQAGDNLLKRLSEIFKKHFREMDKIGRYGGDEFIVMFPETKKEEAAKLVQSLLNTLQMYEFSKQSEKRVSFSAGISAYPEDGGHSSELIKAADKALYEAKGAGRNKVVVYTHRVENI
jgi:diguanylate cyclase (GGDEF)-like protein